MHQSVARGRSFALAFVLLVVAALPAAAAASPTILGSVSDPVNLSGIRSIAVSGQYAYSPSYYNGELTTINISNPAAPSIVGEAAPPSTNTQAVDALYNADFITISGGFAYVTSKNANSPTSPDIGTGNGLTIFSLANPAAPTWVGFISDASTGNTNLFGAYGVAVSGNYAYVTAQGCGSTCSITPAGNDVDVIDISTPATPTEAFQVTNPTSGTFAGALAHADGITISGSDAYVTASGPTPALTVISLDSTTPSNDAIVGIAHHGLLSPNDVAVSGNYAYVADGSTDLNVFDLSNPTNPMFRTQLIDSRLSGAYRVLVNGNIAYVAADGANTISGLDVSNPLAPTILASLADSAHLHHTSSLGLALAGRYVVAGSPLLSGETQVNTPAPPTTYYPYPYPQSFDGSPTTTPTNTGTITVLDMDPGSVAVNIAAPANGAIYRQGSSVPASYTCVPSGAAFVTSCGGTVASGALIDTSTLGQHTFSVSGQDSFGQTGSTTVTYTVAATPTAAFTYSPATGIAGSSVSFDGSASTDPNPGGSITGYAWNFGDGTSGNGAHVTHSYGTAGSYTVTLTVTDNLNQTGSVQHTVTVTATTKVVNGAAPKLTSVHQQHRRWREKGKASKHKPPIGTVFSFRLSEKANLTFTFYRLSPGRKSGKACVAPSTRNRHRASCQMRAKAGTLTLNNLTGKVSIKFSGKIGRKFLKPGTYAVVITAKANGKSATTTLTFTIVS